MDQIMGYLKRKKQLQYDLNCIKKYIEGGDYDKSLKQAWIDYNKELEDINEKLNEYVIPHKDELYKRKLELVTQMKEYQDKIKELKDQVDYINSLIVNKEA